MQDRAELIREGFEAFFPGTPDVLASRLAADANGAGTSDCRGRDAILATLAKHHRQGVVAQVVEAGNGAGQEVLMRWFGERMERDFDVADGIASIVVSVRGERIIRMRDCRDHADALAAAGLAAA